MPHWILSTAAALLLSAGLLAQEQVEVSVKVKKDGKVVTDTTYAFDDADQAKQALKMMDMMTGDEKHMKHTGSSEAKRMVFISEDGELTEISEFSGDSAVWVTEKEVDGDHVKVMKYRIKEGEEPAGKHIVKKKEVKVVVSGDDEGNWTVVEGDEKMMDKDENVFIMKGDDEVKVIVITNGGDEDHDHDIDIDHDEEIEVKVVKKKVKE